MDNFFFFDIISNNEDNCKLNEFDNNPSIISCNIGLILNSDLILKS